MDSIHGLNIRVCLVRILCALSLLKIEYSYVLRAGPLLSDLESEIIAKTPDAVSVRPKKRG